MSVYGDGLSAFGNAQTVEIPPDLVASPFGGIANTNDATAKVPLGTLYRYKGKLYRYVKFVKQTNSNTAVLGSVMFWHTTQFDPGAGKFSVTGDYTYALAGLNAIAGVLLCTVTDGYCTWIQVGGYGYAFVAASTVAGDKMIGTADDTMYFNRIAGATAEITSVVFAIALSSVSSNKSYVLILPGVLASF
jgi:uncharacterized membrane protein YtjA (UPF0391 family)